MATKSTKRSARKKAQKPRMEVRELKPTKDPKGGFGKIERQRPDYYLKIG